MYSFLDSRVLNDREAGGLSEEKRRNMLNSKKRQYYRFSLYSLSLLLFSQAKPPPSHNPCLLFLQSQPLSQQVDRKMLLQEWTA
jgi:hypothetical protein